MSLEVIGRVGGDPNIRVVRLDDRAAFVVGRFASWRFVDRLEVLCEHELDDVAGALACAAEQRREDGAEW